MALYVQYGCGFSAPEGWRNFDASPTLRFERLPLIGRVYTRNAQKFPPGVEYGDIVRGLPVPSNSCAGVYASHVLEHLSLADFGRALAETKRILRAGGLFRLVVPDLHTLCSNYLAAFEQCSPEASHTFMRKSYLGMESRPRGPMGFVRLLLGNSDHLWMWDERSLAEALRHQGYVNIRRAEFGDCDDTAFRMVEDPERFKEACAMQAEKP